MKDLEYAKSLLWEPVLENDFLILRKVGMDFDLKMHVYKNGKIYGVTGQHFFYVVHEKGVDHVDTEKMCFYEVITHEEKTLPQKVKVSPTGCLQLFMNEKLYFLVRNNFGVMKIVQSIEEFNKVTLYGRIGTNLVFSISKKDGFHRIIIPLKDDTMDLTSHVCKPFLDEDENLYLLGDKEIIFINRTSREVLTFSVENLTKESIANAFLVKGKGIRFFDEVNWIFRFSNLKLDKLDQPLLNNATKVSSKVVNYTFPIIDSLYVCSHEDDVKLVDFEVSGSKGIQDPDGRIFIKSPLLYTALHAMYDKVFDGKLIFEKTEILENLFKIKFQDFLLTYNELPDSLKKETHLLWASRMFVYQNLV